ncbi:MAG: MBL fold metallo-hydrolase [Bacteroidota bacterium]|jgi:hydroxyacylglutathione hydrolase
MQVAQFTFNPFSENTFVLFDKSKQCAIVDPGCSNHAEQQELTAFIAQQGLTPVLLLNTHCHIDHVLGNAFVAKTYNLPLHLHQLELQTYADTGRWADMFGLMMEEMPKNQIFIDEPQQLTFGNTTLQVLFTPGHSIASVSFYESATKQLIAGDVLFYQSIGRTDLPGGDFDVLANSIRTKIYTLPDETTVYCGHGPKTAIGFEKQHNPFVQA